MDSDFSKHKSVCSSSGYGVGIAQEIDAAAIFLDTLHAFEEADRLEHMGVSNDFAPGNEESFLPSLENILVFSSYIKEKIDFLLTFNGIPYEPHLEFDLDNRRGQIIVRGNRVDLRKITKIVNKDHEVRDGLVTLLSIAQQTYQLLESLDGDESFPEFTEDGKVIYIYGDGYLSLYKED